ncbi:MAG: SDR family NAD(P)-dependent oxidoreductase [Actinobacteria bacterium]|nr:MAG: SDR family NAD(P)-dependent oxidoreductase [Actinomycetota bacterium]
MELAGKTALLTGATGGLGRAIAGALAERGVTLVLSARRADPLRELADSLPGEGHRPVVADLAAARAGERLVADAGDVDVLVANAGLPGAGQLDGYSADQLAASLRVNLEAPLEMTRALLPHLRELGSGHLVYVSSLQGKVAFPRSSVYSATKFGLRGFALSLREDLWDTGIGVSVVLPGFIRDAGMFADSGAKAPAGLGTSSPEEVGEGVATAIEQNRAEVQVAPLLQRLGAGFAHRRPHLAARITRRNAARTADRVIEGQAGKL